MKDSRALVAMVSVVLRILESSSKKGFSRDLFCRIFL
jgi:hypothetical protein